jgi:multimeric flavodoxin WrbA
VKVLAFNGSPRKGGNTQTLLAEAIRGVQTQGSKVTVYNLNETKIRPCQNCGACERESVCVIQDEMQAVYRDIRSSDRIILASPIFFFGLSAQAKAMVDRCQAFWNEKYVHKKPILPGEFGRKGLLLLVGGMKRDSKNSGYQCAEITARAFFRTVNVEEHVTLSYDAVDEKGAIMRHPSALKEAYEAGIELVKP